MSGFGIRAFKRLKDDSLLAKDRKKYFSHIIVGNDFLSVWTYLKLRQEHGKEHVCLITTEQLSKKSLEEDWKCSINTLRSEEMANKLIGLKPELEIFPSNTKVQFYKDTKFHEFGKRAKSLTLLEGEENFLNPYFHVNYQKLFSEHDWENLDEILSDQVNKILGKIELTNPEDLVEKTHFKLHTGEHESFNCEYLHWMDNPKKFYQLVLNKDNLNDAISEYCTRLNSQTGVVIHFECNQKISKEAGTFFLPQSMTHEWGHFIVDFDLYDQDSQTQSFSGLILLKEDDLSEEELAKKIKLLKRVIERVFPDFAKCKYTESIRFSEDMFIYGMNDELKSTIHHEMPKLEFSGVAAPLDFNIENSFSTSRGIASILS